MGSNRTQSVIEYSKKTSKILIGTMRMEINSSAQVAYDDCDANAVE